MTRDTIFVFFFKAETFVFVKHAYVYLSPVAIHIISEISQRVNAVRRRASSVGRVFEGNLRMSIEAEKARKRTKKQNGGLTRKRGKNEAFAFQSTRKLISIILFCCRSEGRARTAAVGRQCWNSGARARRSGSRDCVDRLTFFFAPPRDDFVLYSVFVFQD
jgi:hypothetical protein